jgi:hypothetical protein
MNKFSTSNKMKGLKPFTLNLGPQHYGAYGVLCLILILFYAVIIFAQHYVDLLCSSSEKLMEYKNYLQALPYLDRLDYVSMMCQEHSHVLALEKLLSLEISLRSQLDVYLAIEVQKLFIYEFINFGGLTESIVFFLIGILLLYGVYKFLRIVYIFIKSWIFFTNHKDIGTKIIVAGAAPFIGFTFTEADYAKGAAIQLAREAATHATAATQAETKLHTSSGLYNFARKLFDLALNKCQSEHGALEQTKIACYSAAGKADDSVLALNFFGKEKYVREYAAYLKAGGRFEYATADLQTFHEFFEKALTSVKADALAFEKARQLALVSKQKAEIAATYAASLAPGLGTLEYVLIGIGGTLTVIALLGLANHFYPSLFASARKNQDPSLAVDQITFESSSDSVGGCTGKWLWNKMWEIFGYHNLESQNALIALELQKAEEARLAQLAEALAIKAALAKKALALALLTFLCNVIGLLLFTLVFDYVLLLIYYEFVVKDNP